VLTINGWAALRKHRNALAAARRGGLGERPAAARRPKVKTL